LAAPKNLETQQWHGAKLLTGTLHGKKRMNSFSGIKSAGILRFAQERQNIEKVYRKDESEFS